MKRFASKADFAFLLLLTGCGVGNPVGVRFDATVPYNQQAIIESDLSFLASLQLPTANPADLYNIGISDLAAGTMVKWLGKRMKHIVGEEYNWVDNVRAFQLANKTPLIMVASTAEQLGASKTQTVMWNVGSHVYLKSKELGYGFYLDVSTDVVDVRSTRAGVVQIGEGLFQANAIRGLPLDSLANVLLRIGTYFHESRHSDGNGTNAAFPHAYCPSTFQNEAYRNQAACETNLNGPYAIQVALLRYFYSACQSYGCSQTELHGLELSMADYQSRILPGAVYRDPRPEAVR